MVFQLIFVTLNLFFKENSKSSLEIKKLAMPIFRHIFQGKLWSHTNIIKINCKLPKMHAFHRNVWNFKKGDFNRLNMLLSEYPWDTLFVLDNIHIVDTWTDVFLSIAKECIPYTMYTNLGKARWATLYDSVFGKRVLMYWENRETPDYCQMNWFIGGIENYIFLERGKPNLSKNV